MGKASNAGGQAHVVMDAVGCIATAGGDHLRNGEVGGVIRIRLFAIEPLPVIPYERTGTEKKKVSMNILSMMGKIGVARRAKPVMETL